VKCKPPDYQESSYHACQSATWIRRKAAQEVQDRCQPADRATGSVISR